MNNAIRLGFPGMLLGLIVAVTPAPAAWFKGNTHVHTINSDGDSSPDTVARWYKEHGYNFLFVTDHNSVTRVDGLNALLGGERFLVLAGEEVTTNSDAPPLHVHVNALNPRGPVPPGAGASAREVLQQDLDAIRASGGLAQINHPNFFWQLTADDIAATHGATLLEIRNMHPLHNNLGAGPARPGTEAIWDALLTEGVTLWGVASDDLHRLKTEGLTMDQLALEASPGQGWIMVEAERLGPDEIMDALEHGRFYASTGVTLKNLAATPKEVTVEVESRQVYPSGYVITFIGAGGRVLQTVVGTKSIYRPRGDEGYVRVRIEDANGHGAWTQPVMLAAGN